MRAIREFEGFIKEGIVKKQSPDKSRAEFLVKESEKSYLFLIKKIASFGIVEETANDLVKSCYDILMESIRSRMLLQGYNASGHGAHEAEVSYMRTLGFSEKDVQFADQIRYFRNGMLYYGTALDKGYAEKVIEFTKKIYAKLKQ
jgi:hypothetical protein